MPRCCRVYIPLKDEGDDNISQSSRQKNETILEDT